MNLYIYSDESGVFDKVHNDIFVFGGIVFLSKKDKDVFSRKYLNVEKTIRLSEKLLADTETKASNISNDSKRKLYQLASKYHRFSVVVNQKRIFDSIFQQKKTKQRYLDYAYKIAIKKKTRGPYQSENN